MNSNTNKTKLRQVNKKEAGPGLIQLRRVAIKVNRKHNSILKTPDNEIKHTLPVHSEPPLYLYLSVSILLYLYLYLYVCIPWLKLLAKGKKTSKQEKMNFRAYLLLILKFGWADLGSKLWVKWEGRKEKIWRGKSTLNTWKFCLVMHILKRKRRCEFALI